MDPLAALRQMPCPKGDACTAFQCLFQHNATPVIVPAVEYDPTMPITVFPDPEDRQDTPRKRQKVALDDRPASTENTPPPTKRLKTAQSAPKAPTKTESLNPRHVPKAPAQHDLRLKLVKALYEQYKRLNDELKADANDEESKLVMTDQQLIVRTLDEEQEAATTKGKVYGNSFKNRIMTYKRMKVGDWKEERMKAVKETTATTSGRTKPDPSEPVVTGLTPAQEVKFLTHLITPLDSLAQFSYVSTIPSQQEIEAVNQSVKASGNTELCDRNGCGRRFQVFPGRREEDGALTTNGSCTHHPGKIYTTERSALDRLSKSRRKYRCCQTDIDDSNAEKGCTTAPTHVFKASDPKRLASVLQFARTPANDNVPSDRAIAFDCEMGYTVYGMELIRLTVVSWPEGAELLDVLVQPFGEVLDLNSRYSGVRPEDMAKAVRWKAGDDHRPVVNDGPSPSSATTTRKLKIVPSPKAARDLMFTLISPRTPIIGHALENDLNAVRMVHPTVVDTVLLYPHRRGALPLRYGLKYLMDFHLGRQIQTAGETPSGGAGGDDGVGVVGHDSAEDARAAGDLVRLRVKEKWAKMQVDGWTLDAKTDSFVAPAAASRP
ncbi:hypothetical protein Micbo1qcDRAFT_197731 [Microdochium bolleyi]|uniref:Exonuclease domain-containing protein n=1 Tax=Microdochium bolleyi TaxID=196109 RepID=A0A136IS85_9PEZI|nr:hypothetical protein Micbo1qcDRAFT_197731 [Microdochium bolleyi]